MTYFYDMAFCTEALIEFVQSIALAAGIAFVLIFAWFLIQLIRSGK